MTALMILVHFSTAGSTVPSVGLPPAVSKVQFGSSGSPPGRFHIRMRFAHLLFGRLEMYIANFQCCFTHTPDVFFPPDPFTYNGMPTTPC